VRKPEWGKDELDTGGGGYTIRDPRDAAMSDF